LTEEEKKKYNDLDAQDKERYEREKAEYLKENTLPPSKARTSSRSQEGRSERAKKPKRMTRKTKNEFLFMIFL